MYQLPGPPVVESTLPFSVALVSVISVAGWRTPTAQPATTTPTAIVDKASAKRFMRAPNGLASRPDPSPVYCVAYQHHRSGSSKDTGRAFCLK